MGRFANVVSVKRKVDIKVDEMTHFAKKSREEGKAGEWL